ncbi:Glucosamine-6-phosphate deaminase [Diplonema papillatum]|nr:Glucosamine-6-phosphate deaminase [Diplonema papillatum]
MRIQIEGNPEGVAVAASEHIIERINAFGPTEEKPFVLGLPTGGTPMKTYQKLIQAHRAGRVDFRNIVTFNMDEYVDLAKDHPESYHSFMWNNFFSFVNIQKRNVHILDGNAPDLEAECARYEEAIKKAGGIHLFMGGLGTDGHIAFNEPGSALHSRTRVKSLNRETIESNARFFEGDVSQVPTMALTVGVATILDAQELLFLVTGTNKAKALAMCLEGAISNMWTGSALQMHPKTTVVADDLATSELTVRTVRYFKDLQNSERQLKKRQEKLRSHL